MSDLSNYLEEAIYNYFFRPGVGAPTRPTSLSISLWSDVTDSEAGTGTELSDPSSAGYARPAVTMGAFASGSGANDAVVLWPFNSGGGNWVTATHYGIHDHLGNLLQALKLLPAPITIPPGQRATAEIGDLVLNLD